MKSNTRTDHEVRVRAFDLLHRLKSNHTPRKEVIDKIHSGFGISRGTLYSWYSGAYRPFGRRGALIYKPELFYVFGALLGDGYTYSWKDGYLKKHFRVGLDVKDKVFAVKYAQKLSKAINFKVNVSYYVNKKLWYVRLDDKNLYSLVNKLRASPKLVIPLINRSQKSQLSAINFIEGFFDADGCVKIINDSSRKVPKICPDFTSTDSDRIEVIKILLRNYLGIEARYSNQDAYLSKDGSLRKKTYHLRIYKKESVKRLLKKVKTFKLYREKVPYMKQWMSNKWRGGPHPITSKG
jgi:predicted DNA-binding protein (MmcQ/YjbR family)